jgi:hypothetical protein
MDIKDGVTMSSKEQLRSPVRVRMQGKITSKGGKDKCATTDHPRGLRRKVWTSYEKTPYLDRRDDDLKMPQMKGAKCKMWRWAAGRKTGPNRPRKGLGRLAWSDRPSGFCGNSARPLTYTTWKTSFGNGRRSPLVTGNAPVTDQVLQISQEK